MGEVLAERKREKEERETKGRDASQGRRYSQQHPFQSLLPFPVAGAVKGGTPRQWLRHSDSQLSIELTTEGLNCRLSFIMDRHFKLIAEIEPELVLWPHCGQEGEIRWLQR